MHSLLPLLDELEPRIERHEGKIKLGYGEMYRKHVAQDRRRVVRLGRGAIQRVQRPLAERVPTSSTKIVLLPPAAVENRPVIHHPMDKSLHLGPLLIGLGKFRLGEQQALVNRFHHF